jgi:tRNA (mo5U34)-methyltransferase
MSLIGSRGPANQIGTAVAKSVEGRISMNKSGSGDNETYRSRLEAQVRAEPYWFHQIPLREDLVTPGWSNPLTDKIPYYGLPDDMSGLRVLDVGCAEGYFSFEAERRGASEVVAIDSFPDSVRRFNICREALGSNATAYLTNVYDLSERTFGTFDLVMFFGVLYHLRHPILAIEKIFSVTSGTLLLQTASFEEPSLGDVGAAKFHPFGIESGPADSRVLDPTVFWVPNAAGVRDMLRHVGFVNIEGENKIPGAVFRGDVPIRRKGVAPDPMKAPWS